MVRRRGVPAGAVQGAVHAARCNNPRMVLTFGLEAIEFQKNT